MTAADTRAGLPGETPGRHAAASASETSRAASAAIGFADVLAYGWRYWRSRPWSIAFLLVCGIAGPLLLDVLGPIFTGRMIDALVVADGDLARPLYWLALFLATAAGYLVLKHAGEVVWMRMACDAMRRMIQDGFRQVQGYSTDWHANTFAGSTVRSLTRGMWAFDQFGDVLYLNLLPMTAVLTGVAVALTVTFPLVGALCIAFILVFGWVSIAMAAVWAKPALDRSNEADTEIGGSLSDAIGGNAVVKAFAAEAREEERFGGVMAHWHGCALAAWGRLIATSAVQGALWLGFRLAVLGLALWLWSVGRATPGDVVYILINHFIIGGYIRDVGQHIRMIQQSISEMEDVVRFAALPTEVHDAPGARPLHAPRGEIAFDRVTFRYAGQSRATYEDFSITLEAGEKVALVGPSGSGKSTFVKLTQRLYDLQGGRILIDGQDIAGVTQASLRRAIALVPQEPALFHRSLAENIAYGRPGADRRAIVDAARRAHADEFIARLPKGYDTLVGERGVKLSGGERQRVAIARAILTDAPILILDEATSALDSESEALIQDALAELMRGRTAVVIAHRLSTIRHVDRILVFDGGRVVEDGPHARLIADPDGQYRRLYEIQAGGFLLAGQ
jgi:ATP-binding cassette subfamily B protein